MAQTGGGSIVNIVSVAAQMVCPESPVYHIAKAGPDADDALLSLCTLGSMESG